MSEFARKQLEKYGWTDGKGLGKEENGIMKPIRAVVKADTHGIGHDRVNILASRWWCDVFNQASQRVNVVNDMTGVHLSSEKASEGPKLPSANNRKQKFIKAETVTEYSKIPTIAENLVSGTCSSPSQNLSDPGYLFSGDCLYKECDGVRNKYGKSLKAKHKRIQRQDVIYSKKIKMKKKVREKYELE